MRALVTNDDGINTIGIRTLASVAAGLGLDVLIAAPSGEASGSSASLRAVEDAGKFRVEEQRLDALSDIPAYAVEASPAFIVRAAISGAFGAVPDVILSGINHGPNTGHAILHSGTVGAALTAATFHRSALAVSLANGATTHLATAEEVTRQALRWLLDTPATVVLNVNIPDVPLDGLCGLRRAELAEFGAVQTVMTESGRGYVKLAYEPVTADYRPGTDAALLAAGYAPFTPLVAICAARGVDTSALGASVTRQSGNVPLRGEGEGGR